MTLLEIDKRVEFILEAKKSQQKHFLKDLSNLIFYGVCYGHSATQSKKGQPEQTFHKTIDTLLQIDIEKTDSDNPAAELDSLFK